jgi:hypothetical protein
MDEELTKYIKLFDSKQEVSLIIGLLIRLLIKSICETLVIQKMTVILDKQNSAYVR